MIFLQYIIPQHLLSRLIYKLTRIKSNVLVRWVMRRFIHYYQVDLSIAERSHINEYDCFNDFFTRHLKKNQRPISNSHWVCPVDGYVSQCGRINGNRLIQAKGKTYQLNNLLTSEIDATLFENGQFATVYLAPKDYHRIHMPCDGQLLKMVYVPGRLFSVNLKTSHCVKNLFCQNERLICHFKNDNSRFILVLVGAIFVGSMHTVWQGQITPPYGKDSQTWHYHADNITFNKGDEIGHFNMGSTVILLLNRDSHHLTLKQQTNVLMGQNIV